MCGAGLVGSEVSMFLAEQGKTVTMIDMIQEPAMELAIYTRWALIAKLAELGVQTKCAIKSWKFRIRRCSVK